MKKFIIVVAGFVCLIGTANAGQRLLLNYGNARMAKEPTEGDLRIWLKKQPLISRKVNSIVQDARTVDTEEVPPNDLRDALSPLPDKNYLPEFGEPCRTVQTCPQALTSVHVDNPDHIREAIIALIRPWITLQKAKHQPLEFRALSNSPDGILRLTLKDVSDTPLELAAEVMPGGGVTVMLRSTVDPAGLYEQQRQALISNNR